MSQRSFKDLEDDFSLLDDWEDRYKYVIELGKELPPFDPELKDEQHRVHGCVSQVWINFERCTGPNGSKTMRFNGDSDAIIVKGLIAVVRSLLSDRPLDEIVREDARAALSRLGLHEHLTPQRSNGLAAMVETIQSAARKELA